MQMVVLASLMVNLLLGGVISRSLHGRIDVMFGPVVTTEAHLAFSGARIHSNNTAEMTAMIEAVSVLGPRGAVTRDEESCICYDSMHAAGICLGTIQAWTHVQLALACQQSQSWSNVGCGSPCNTCTVTLDVLIMPLHLAHLGFTSSHNIATRWVHHNFDATACFDDCNNINESWNDCSTFEQMQHHFLKIGSRWFFSSGPPCACAIYVTESRVFFLLSVFSSRFLFPQRVIDRLSSSASTVPSIDGYLEHNMWNPP